MRLQRATSGSQAFRLSWLGYNRADVDQFLESSAADRQRVDDGIAVLTFLAAESPDGPAAAMSLALREAQQIWANATVEARRLIEEAQNESDYIRHGYAADFGGRGTFAGVVDRWGSSHTFGRVAALAASAVVFALLLGASAYQIVSGAAGPTTEHVERIEDPSATETPGNPVTEATPVASERGLPASGIAGSPLPADPGGLVVTLTALRLCWIRTTTDGGQPVEHLLQPNETISVRAESETILRIGDAAALSMRINEHVARPLGGEGQVVTTRITRSNYSSFLATESPLESLSLATERADGTLF